MRAPDPNAPDPSAPGARAPESGPAVFEPGTTRVSDSGVYTVTGRGDIAPEQTGPDVIQMSFQGVFVAVVFMVALGALFITTEYKRGMIRTTFTATPRRARVLAAKALVIGGVTFAVSLVATAITFPLAQSTMRSNGFKPPRTRTCPSWTPRPCERSSAARRSCPWWRSSPSRQGRYSATARARSRWSWSW